MISSVENVEAYLLQEAAFLRTYYGELRKETRSLESYCLLSVGAIWSWCATHETSSHVAYLIWLPVIVASLFGVRALGIYFQMRAIKDYALKLESRIAGVPDDLGWERYIRNRPSQAFWPATAYLFWGLLSVLTVVVPWLLW